jgi:hypothetical protein
MPRRVARSPTHPAQRLVIDLGINHLTLNPAMLRMLSDQVDADADLGPVR